MAVRVVASNAPAQPDDVADAQIVGEALSPGPGGRGPCCGTGPRSSRHSSVVSRLPRPLTSMRLLRSTTRTGFPSSSTRGTQRCRQSFRAIPPWDVLVLEVVVILGPGVEFPVDQPDGLSG